MSQAPLQLLDDDAISILRCPVTRGKLRLIDDFLVSEVGGLKYAIRNGIPNLLPEDAILPPGIETLEAFRERFGER